MDISSIGDYGINDLLNREFECRCGKKHSVKMKRVVIEKGALAKLPEVLRDFNFKKPFMVCDRNTYKAAGREVENILASSGINCRKLVYERENDLVPDERAAGEFIIGMDNYPDVIVTVGTGVLNDLSKFMSKRFGIPSVIVATAPSMDGFASDGSALILNNLKTTLASVPPLAIIGDIEVLQKAPMEMILAGFEDMLGKYTAIRDWKLGSIINGEYYCDKVVEIMEKSLEKCTGSIEGLKAREDEAVGNLMEGLVMSGIAMSFVGNSRPASGSEHHISHFWEMMFLQEGRKAVLHGVKVGIGTLISGRMGEKLAETALDFDSVLSNVDRFDTQRWEADMEKIFRSAAPEIIKLNKKPADEVINERRLRIKSIRDNWDAVIRVLREVPTMSGIEDMLKQAGAAIWPGDIGINRETALNGVVYAREVRPRYTLLQLLWDIGLLDRFARECLEDGGRVG